MLALGGVVVEVVEAFVFGEDDAEAGEIVGGNAEFGAALLMVT